MSKYITEQLIKSREVRVNIGKFTFICLRPTHAYVANTRSNMDDIKIAEDGVIGWEGVTEDDILKNKNTDTVPFDKELWIEWLKDSPDFWTAIATRLVQEYIERCNKVTSELKK
jgi:hypothetical protein